MTLDEKIERLTADQELALLVLLDGEKDIHRPSPQPDQIANPSTIASLFAGWSTAWQNVNASGAESLTDENLTLVASAMNAAEEAILALPARDAVDVWRKVVIGLNNDGPDPRTQAGQLLAAAHTALGIAG